MYMASWLPPQEVFVTRLSHRDDIPVFIEGEFDGISSFESSLFEELETATYILR